MLRLVVIVFVIIIALLRGGSLRNFNDLKLRWLPLVIIGSKWGTDSSVKKAPPNPAMAPPRITLR